MKILGLRALAIVAILSLSAVGARAAEPSTTNDLVKCMREYEAFFERKPGADGFAAGYYCGYVSGLADGSMVASRPGVTQGQLWATVAKYLKSHPEKWNKHPAVVVLTAIKEAFPAPAPPTGRPRGMR